MERAVERADRLGVEVCRALAFILPGPSCLPCPLMLVGRIVSSISLDLFHADADLRVACRRSNRSRP